MIGGLRAESNNKSTPDIFVDEESNEGRMSPKQAGRTQKTASCASPENDLALAQAMRAGLASKTYDRRWPTTGGRLYKKCFLHSDAVEWMRERMAPERSETITSGSLISDSLSVITSSPKPGEVEAVNRLNCLVDKGFVSHVCGKHRFVVAKYRTLFFRFRDDVIGNAEKSHQRWEENDLDYSERGLVLEDKLKRLETTTQRLCHTVEQYSHMLAEANGKILVLEESLASIGFAFMVFLLVSVGLIIFHFARGHVDSTKASTMAVIFVVVTSLSCGGLGGLDVVADNVAMLGRLMRPTDNIEGPFMRHVERESEFCNGTAEVLHQSQSVMERMSKAIIQVPQEIEATMRTPKEASIQMRESSDIPEVSTWPHRPVLACVNTPVSNLLMAPEVGQGACPLGVPFNFSSELFEGKCLLRFKDVSSDDPAGDANYFLGRRRLFQAIVQGKFKKELPVSDVLTGHEFARPLQRLPPSWMVRAGTNLIRRLAPGTEFRLNETQPRALSILAATAQVLSADAPGNEPDITDNDIKEDVSMFGGIFGNGTATVPQRKKHLSDPRRAKDYTFDTDSVYTFDFYQSLLDCKSYSLDLGFTKVGLSKSLDGQPIQVLAKTRDGRYLWSFQIWNESLLKAKSE